jgi:hypothetical protein
MRAVDRMLISCALQVCTILPMYFDGDDANGVAQWAVALAAACVLQPCASA